MAQPNPNPRNNPAPNGPVMKPTPRTTVSQPASGPAPTAARPTTVRNTKAHGPVRPFLFGKTNYQIMIVGVVLILLGLFLMAGGKSPDPHVFRYDEVFSFRRVTLAPVLMMIGFCLEFYAILKRPAATTPAAVPVA